ncbi:hypothetical protein OSTOST_08828 [Ostertagia ostertagi]
MTGIEFPVNVKKTLARLNALNLYLLEIGYGLNRDRTSPDHSLLDCRRTLEQQNPRFFRNSAEPCFEDNDLMTSFNAQPVPNTGHPIFIPAHHPSELRNWHAQANVPTSDSVGDQYNGARKAEESNPITKAVSAPNHE